MTSKRVRISRAIRRAVMIERAQVMRALRAQGLTLDAIGTRFGVSRQRVHQLCRQG